MENKKMTEQEKREILIEQDKERKKYEREQRQWVFKQIQKSSSLKLINTL